ncbi:MAG: hypothetical protein AAF430_17770 [Myxococcota bacterium]
MAAKVRAAGGEIYAVSSEPQGLSARARTDWELDFETVGDPHHEIAETCRERGWVDLFVNERIEFLERSVAASDADFEVTHPNGYFQPGVLAVGAGGRVLYRWRGVPTHQNMGGATERPTAEYVWSRLEQALAGDGTQGDAALDTDPPLDSRGIPWPLFSSLLMANGWFLGPRGFRSPKHILYAGLRWIGFIAAWIAAFALLPKLPVAVALAGWVAYIAPKYRWVGEQFQEVEVPAG